MNYDVKFKEIYGSQLPSGQKAFALEMPINATNPIKVVSGHIPKGAKVTMKNRVLYVMAESFTHPDAVKLAV